jgi:hypothetical protein
MWDTVFSTPAIWFTVPALGATALFLLKLTLMIVLGDADDPGNIEAAHSSSSPAAELFSLQAVLAFLMGLGWGGLGGLISLKLGTLASGLIGLGCGIMLVGLFVGLMRSMRRMNSSGNIDLAKLANIFGDVTIAVPKAGAGVGEVRVIVNDRERRANAVSTGEALPSRTRIKIVSVNPDNTVTVTGV